MSLIGLITGRGPAGLPPATPVDFGALRLPGTPNAHLLAPAGSAAPAHETMPPLPVPPEQAWDAARRLGEGVARCWPIAAWPELRQAQWVVRTALMNYPDIVVAQVTELPGGAGLYLYSRSLVGYSDMGVNRGRVAEWRGRLEAMLRRG